MKTGGVRTAVVLVGAAIALPAACTTGGVVGGGCRDGLSVCDGQCVDLAYDNSNCGRCGYHCPADLFCAVGTCGNEPPPYGVAGNGGALGTAGNGAGGREPATGGEGGQSTGGATPGGAGQATGGVAGAGPRAGAGGAGGLTPPGGGTAGTGAGGAPSGGTGPGGGAGGDAGCLPPYNTPDRCGDCTTRCPAAAPLCAPVGGTHACVPRCEAPLEECGDQCVELASDAANCGQCFKRCASGICQSGTCVGAVPGNLVLMCLNYRQTVQGRSQQALLGNAVFLPTGNPVRVLAYTQYTSDRLIGQVTRTLDWAASDRARTYDWATVTDPQTLSSTLSIFDHDVLLVPDQDAAPDATTLSDLGSVMAGTLDGFARAGGTIVVLSGVTGAMTGFFTSGGLLDTSAQSDVTGSQIYNRSPGNVIGVGVVSPFRALQDTCVFETTVTEDGSTFFVVTDTDPASSLGLGRPVVVHRVVSGG